MTDILRVAISGTSGQLGSALTSLVPQGWTVLNLSRRVADITDERRIREWISFEQPDLVIHAAAMTDVDGCERFPDEAFRVNALGTRYLARAAAQIGARFVYVSTNFVFSGDKGSPYHEFDRTDPISVYGASKLAGEFEAMSASIETYVVRTSMVFAREGRNFVNTMLGLMADRDELSVVSDQFGNPTYAPDLAEAIHQIVQTAPFGLYHVVNSGEASWHEWACEIARLRETGTRVREIPGVEFKRDASPPPDGRMASLALPNLGIELPHWKDALRRCLVT